MTSTIAMKAKKLFPVLPFYLHGNLKDILGVVAEQAAEIERLQAIINEQREQIALLRKQGTVP